MALLVPQLSTAQSFAWDPPGESGDRWNSALENTATEEQPTDGEGNVYRKAALPTLEARGRALGHVLCCGVRSKSLGGGSKGSRDQQVTMGAGMCL